MPTRSSVSRVMRSACCLLLMRRADSHTFSHTDRPLNRLGTWVLMPMPRRPGSCGCMLEMSWPRNRIWPELGLVCPVSSLKKVLLPAPLGPMTQRSSASARLKLTSRVACTPPKRTFSRRVSSRGTVLIGRPPGRQRCAGIGIGPGVCGCGRRAAPAPDGVDHIAQAGHDAARHQQHEHHQDGAQHQVGIEGLLGADGSGQPLDGHAAHHRADQGAQAAHDHPDDDLCRHRQAEDGGAGEGAPVGEQAAGQPGDGATQAEAAQLVERGRRSPAAAPAARFPWRR